MKIDCDPIHLDKRLYDLENNFGEDKESSATTLIPQSFVIPWDICDNPNTMYFYQRGSISGYLLWAQYDLMTILSTNGSTTTGDLTINQWLHFPGSKMGFPALGDCVCQTMKSINGFSYTGSQTSSPEQLLEKDVFDVKRPKLAGATSTDSGVDVFSFGLSTWNWNPGSKWLDGSTGNATQDVYPTGTIGVFTLKYNTTENKYYITYYSRSGTAVKDINITATNTKAIIAPTSSINLCFVQYGSSFTGIRDSSYRTDIAQGAFVINSSLYQPSNTIEVTTNVYSSGGTTDLKRIDEDFDPGITSRVHPYILANI